MPNNENKKTIAVDIDDVLAANAEGFVAFSNKRWGTNLKPDDYTEHWAEMWAIDHEEVEERRLEIINAKVFTKHRFFDEAKPVLKKLKERYKLAVVTSRGPMIRAETLKWIDKEYRGIIEEVHFAEIWDDSKTDILKKLKFTKTEILKQVGADYLIDDQPKHCIAAAEAGIISVLFGDYKWNRYTKLTANMVRAKNWQEVLEYFDESR